MKLLNDLGPVVENIDNIIQNYEIGKFTSTDLMLSVFQIVTKSNIDMVMAIVPYEVFPIMEQFVKEYYPDLRVWNGPKPPELGVQLIKNWFAERTSDNSGDLNSK